MNDDELMDEEPGDELGDEMLNNKKSGYFRKLVALLVLLAFIAISVPNFPYLFSNALNFLEQNRALKEDEIVQRCKPAVVSIEATVGNGLLNT
ncbi:hypothetical protein [Desulfosporosinus fructosivorans]